MPLDQHKEKSFLDFVNPASLSIQNAKIEPSLASLAMGERVQFQRLGYYTLDTDTTPSSLVFNKIVGLRDTWAKKQ